VHWQRLAVEQLLDDEPPFLTQVGDRAGPAGGRSAPRA
jgi:hypothetical protein